MKLLRYELKKILGMKYLWAALVLLVAASSAYFYYLWLGPDSYMKNSSREMTEITDDFFRRCREEPETVEPIREKYDEYTREAERVSQEIREGMTEEELIGFRVTEEMLAERGVTYEDSLGYTLSDGTPVRDGELFLYYDEISGQWKGMLRHLDNVIDVTEGAMIRYESVGATDLPVYGYESHFNSVYTSLREELGRLDPGFGYESGWTATFYYLELPVFMFAFLLLAAGVIFLNERSVGLLPVIRTTRGGRMKTAAAKLGALLTVSVCAAILFSAAQLLTTYLTVGLSDPSVSVHVTRWECPYPLSVGEYFLAVTAGRCVAAAAFSCAVALVSVVSFSHVATYAFGVLFIGANVYMSSMEVGSSSGLPNLVDLAGHTLIEHYSEVLVFGRYESTLAVTLALALGIIAVSGAALVLFGGQRSFIPSPRRLSALAAEVRVRVFGAADRLREKLSARLPHKRHTSLFRWELYRMLPVGTVLLLIILYGASVFTSVSRYGEPLSERWSEYEDYVKENFIGPVDEEKSEEILALRDEKTYLSSSEGIEYMMGEFGSGNITLDEYSEFLNSIDGLRDEALALETLADRVEYLDGLREQNGTVGWAMPDAMLTRVLDRGVNWFLLFAVIVLFSRTYAQDYAKKSSEGEFYSILRTTRHGRRRLFRVRYGAVAAAAFALALLFECTDLFIGVAHTDYISKVLGAPASSLPTFGAVRGLSVGGLLAVEALLRTLPYVLLALICASASFALRRVSTALFAVAAVTLLPYAIAYMGQPLFRYADVIPMFSGGELLVRSAEFGTFGATYGFALLFAACYAALAVAAALLVRRKIGE